MKGQVYCLIDSSINLPFYVGITTVGLDNRLRMHIYLTRKCNSKLYKHMRENNIKPKIKKLQVLINTTKKELLKAELEWIKKLNSDGLILFNTVKMLPTSIVSNNDYGQNIRVPLNEFNTIKKYVTEKNYKIGKFLAAAAIEKIERLKNNG